MSAVLLLAVLAAALPAGTEAEEASQPSEPAAAQLDAGRNHTCAMLVNADVRCWGFGGEGELGYGNPQMIGDNETPGSAGPVDLGGGRTAVSISAGNFHTCAQLDDNSVRCWGYGLNGQLGYGTTVNVGDNEPPGSVGPVSLGDNRFATAISAGGYHTCALLNDVADVNDGSVRCWGYGAYGALGRGGEVNNPAVAGPPDIGDNELPGSEPAVNFGPGRKARAISAGGYHTCALLDDGSVRCWGLGTNGQLGYGDNFSVSDPSTPVAPVNFGVLRAVAISAGEIHTCALLEDATVRCWGAGLEGRLGYGNEEAIGDSETLAVQPAVQLGGRAVAISSGGAHSCARLEDNSLRCWGHAAWGQLGYGNRTNIGDTETPASAGPVNLGGGRTALAVSAGDRHTCARLDDGAVSCWGYGGNGRLGYCNERNVGDDELPGTVGPVPVEAAVRAPSSAYPGCARVARVGPSPAPGGPEAQRPLSPLEAEALRRRALRSCLASAARHTRREIRRARRGSARERSRLRRHIVRHRARMRRACLRRHGRTPGKVTGLRARATSRTSVVVSFRAPGTDGSRPPAARTYLVKQSTRPIRGRRGFRRAQTLCKGRCRIPNLSGVGARVAIRVDDLRPRTTYFYAVAARDNVSRRLGPRSRAVGVRTR